ncbi:hypothetical protein [Streptomyces sp. NPDC056672]|uniref:hypothetical protein n=1 Tax=Streptomyces sp. NPDC056672 TaxID=3345906 RepID=UPI00367E39EE
MIGPDPALRTLIENRSGPLRALTATAHGHGSDLTALAEGEQGTVFVKAMRNRAGGRRASLLREIALAPYLPPLAPPLEWAETGGQHGWVVGAWTAVEGRPADLRPGSTDLDRVVGVVRRVGDLPVPDGAAEWAESRWDRFAPPADVTAFRGQALLYTDWHPANFVLGARSTWLVDWSWPTVGAAYISPALLVVELVAAGHAPAEAEGVVAGCASWYEAPPTALDAFAHAHARMCRAAAGRRPGEAWLAAVARAAADWAAHRAGIPLPLS